MAGGRQVYANVRLIQQPEIRQDRSEAIIFIPAYLRPYATTGAMRRDDAAKANYKENQNRRKAVHSNEWYYLINIVSSN